MEKTKMAQPIPQLPVEDVKKAQAYYKDFLGFEIAWTESGNSIGSVQRDDVAIFFSKSEGMITPNVHWMFAEDVDLTYAELKSRGADITDHIEDKPWNQRQFTVRDLNGHIFYVHHDIQKMDSK